MNVEASLDMSLMGSVMTDTIDPTVVEEQIQQCWNNHTLDLLLADSGVSIGCLPVKPLPRRLDSSTHRWQPYPAPRNKDRTPERLAPSSTVEMSEAELVIWAASSIRRIS